MCYNRVKKAYSTFGSKKHRTILYIPLIIQANLINNQCDKFRIGRLALMVIDCVAEQCINRIHLPENLVKSILLLMIYINKKEN